MFESITYEVLLKRMLDRIPSGIDKREGSIIYDALAPAAVELQNMYIELDWMLKQAFADTQDREYLIKRCAERGISPTPSTCAVLKGEFNKEVPIGSRFSIDLLNYRVTQKIGEWVYWLECETAGSEGNRHLGTLIPIQYIPGLTSAELTEVLIPGEDEEETEHLRSRYFASFHSQAFGGNVADYKQKAGQIAGVGGVKVYPVWNGGGTVKLVIQDSLYGVPTKEVLQLVKDTLDPEEDSGKGYGLAPIGHQVTVEGVKGVEIEIRTHLMYQSGWNLEQCRSRIEATVEAYLQELNENWENTEGLVIRISRLESRLLDVEGILDVSETSIQGEKRNWELAADEIAVKGAFYDEGI
ncbi:MAG: baseplate J/gp47 family protein [bacterium]|nr:baseplate J/gp47 family protein [bacterium]